MKNEQLSNPEPENKLPVRLDKTLAWLEESREKWKGKCKETKLQLKRQIFAIKRLKESRDSWKLSNSRFKHESIKDKQAISSLQCRIDELESLLEVQRSEIHVLKKKP
jgi:hypothetical protein